MDVHIVPGVKAKDVAEAHRKDLLLQQEHHCKCMTYWIDEDRENIFCLIEAPDREAVVKMHSEAHGLIPNKIIEVSSTVVQNFLGRIYDPSDALVMEDGLKVFSDSSFRVLLLTTILDPVLLLHRLGPEKAHAVQEKHNTTVRSALTRFGGREAEHSGNGFVSSFSSAQNAISCALYIQDQMNGGEPVPGFRIGINAGEPVEKTNRLFGDTILAAGYLCSVIGDGQLAIAAAVMDLVAKDQYHKKENVVAFTARDEEVLHLLFGKLEERYSDPEFDISDYCQQVAMSRSQLYRKTISLTGVSPNLLLKDFRLEKARELMRNKNYSVAQITFDTGFTSPSYFTKCFKKKYGLLPMAYLDLL